MKLNISKLHTTALATLAQNVIDASKSGDYTLVVQNHPLLLAVEEEYAIYQKVYSKLTFSGKGKEVAELDKTRDSLFFGIKKIVQGYAKAVTLPESEVAQQLLQPIDFYGKNMSQLSYLDETAQILKLIEQLESDEYATQVEQLHLTNVVAELKRVQAEFQTLYNQQAEANAELHSLPSASAIRKDLEEALKSYFKLLDAMKTLDDWKMIYEDINELVKGATR